MRSSFRTVTPTKSAHRVLPDLSRKPGKARHRAGPLSLDSRSTPVMPRAVRPARLGHPVHALRAGPATPGQGCGRGVAARKPGSVPRPAGPNRSRSPPRAVPSTSRLGDGTGTLPQGLRRAGPQSTWPARSGAGERPQAAEWPASCRPSSAGLHVVARPTRLRRSSVATPPPRGRSFVAAPLTPPRPCVTSWLALS